jgi:hypothetical protein
MPIIIDHLIEAVAAETAGSTSGKQTPVPTV